MERIKRVRRVGLLVGGLSLCAVGLALLQGAGEARITSLVLAALFGLVSLTCLNVK